MKTAILLVLGLGLTASQAVALDWPVYGGAGAHFKSASWHLRIGAIVCANYFSVSEGEAAHAKRDNNWLDEIGCTETHDAPDIVILEDGPGSNLNEPSRPWRIRLLSRGATVYTAGFKVVAFLDGREITHYHFRRGEWKQSLEFEKLFQH